VNVGWGIGNTVNDVHVYGNTPAVPLADGPGGIARHGFAGHDIAHAVKDALLASSPHAISDVSVHIEPMK
jgi:hypothetical protein